ncbi:MAG TPA: hypothetical protein VFK17_04630, partial [Gaiellaceae bacterium]|nr:hypothetical protein [Gaiellaceae bacterium]
GPGVDLATSIEGTGKTTWNVTLQAGTYRFRCDAHAAQMTGQLVVGSDSTTTAPTPKPLRARIASVHATRKLVSVKVAAARRARAAATLRLRGKLVAHASGRVPGTLKLRPARALRGRYALRVVVTAGTTRTTLNRTIRIR